MAFRIKAIRPLFTGVVTTAVKYVGDVLTESGLVDLRKKDGELNPYQTVVAVGTTVRDLQPGDIVKINLNRYLVVSHRPGNFDPEQNLTKDSQLIKYQVPMVEMNDKEYLFLQNNDIEYVVTDYDGVEAGGLLQ